MFDFANSILQMISNIIIVVVTVYLAYLQLFCRSVKFLGFRNSYSRFYGQRITIQLRNEALSVVSIERIYLLLKKGSKDCYVPIQEYKIPLLVGPRHSIVVESIPFSNSVFEATDLLHKDKVIFVQFADGRCISILSKKEWKERMMDWGKNYSLYRSLKASPYLGLENLERLPYEQIKFRGQVISEFVKYILVINRKGTTQTRLIDVKGNLNQDLFNGREWICNFETGDKEEIEKVLDNVFAYDPEIHYLLHDARDVTKRE